MKVVELFERAVAEPLDRVRFARPEGGARLTVTDGRGRAYVAGSADDTFTVSGALGWQQAVWQDSAGAEVSRVAFRVERQTRIDDPGGEIGAFLSMLHRTMFFSCANDGATGITIDGRLYRYFICWVRDHTHTLKGMKYFEPEVKSGLELYADTQRADGMIYDRVTRKPDVQGWRDFTFAKGDFIKTLNPGTPISATMQRIPVENDVEFLFVECLYRTWQASGDTEWMTRYLDAALRAVDYATRDPYRWSEQFRLLKRGYTIDTWDFMHEDDSRLTAGDNVCDIDKTTFGIMHGDNTGMAASCRYLAEMLRVAGRDEDAGRMDRLAGDLLERLERIAWNGAFYRHHVSEDPGFVRDIGSTDESQQVSLSNTYALNRGIGQDKCRALIETYQRIRREMPAASPGEFYNLYPPFEKGFDKQDPPWQYMNGGVSTIAAGELARGAFENGHESYGLDIIRRVKSLADRLGGYLHVCLNGNPNTTPPPRSFTPADLSPVAHVTAGWRERGGWGDRGNDLSRLPRGSFECAGVPFQIADDGLGIGVAQNRAGFDREVRLPVNARHASMYLLHTVSSADVPVAEIDVVYDDGETRTVYLQTGKHLDSWFMPDSGEQRLRVAPQKSIKGWPAYRIAWRGENDTYKNVGVFLWGWDNPRPAVQIREIVFRAARNNSLYFAPAITFSDHPVWFPQSPVSYGIPDGWGAAAMVYAIIEGLAGVVDGSSMFETVDLSPRWTATDQERARVSVVYPASGGYVAYDFEHDPAARSIDMTIARSGEKINARVMLPAAAAEASVTCDGSPLESTIEQVGESRYVRFQLGGVASQTIRISYS